MNSPIHLLVDMNIRYFGYLANIHFGYERVFMDARINPDICLYLYITMSKQSNRHTGTGQHARHNNIVLLHMGDLALIKCKADKTSCAALCKADKGRKHNRIIEKVRCEDHLNPMECCCTFRRRQLLPLVSGDVGIVAAEEDDNGSLG